MSVTGNYLKIAISVAALALAAIPMISCQNESKVQVKTVPAVIDSVPSADGVMIYYDVRGEGDPALVFVHCWSGDRSYWDGQTDKFAKDHEVVTIDLAGHGQSGLGRDVWTMTAFGSDIAAVVNKLGLNNIILIGHSMGGAAIVEAARQLPGKVIGLVGVDNFHSIGMTFPEAEVKAFLQPFRDDFPGTTRQFVSAMFPPKADTLLIKRIRDDMSSAPPEVACGAFEEMFKYYFGPPMAEAFKELNLPLICISSDQTPTNIDGNRQIVPSFEVKLMPGTGHFLLLEDPETFNKLLAEAIKELTATDTE